MSCNSQFLNNGRKDTAFNCSFNSYYIALLKLCTKIDGFNFFFVIVKRIEMRRVYTTPYNKLMRKFSFTTLFATFLVISSYAQKDTLTKKDKAALDSMMKADQFFKLMNEKKKNSLDVSVGIGNGSFSTHNKAVNATGMTNQVIFTPGVMYHFKNGIGLGVMGYLSSDSGKMELYQTGLSAGYDYVGKKLNAGGTYTRFVSNPDKYNSNSLFQNDLYAYVKKSSGIIQPMLSLGYSEGKYKEIDKIKFRRPAIGDTIIIKDSTENNSSYFSTALGVEHDFSFYKLFSKGDELEFVPSLVINAGSDKTTTTHTNKALTNKPLLNRRARQAASDNFQLQSIAASFDVTYSIGKFFLQPTLYLDYYLPSTTTNRFSAIYNVTAGFSF